MEVIRHHPTGKAVHMCISVHIAPGCRTGMALATLFVTLPFVVRELIPVLEQMDPAEEEAARTLGASDWEVFWQVTLPNIKWGLLYGIILTNAVCPPPPPLLALVP